MSTVTNSTHSGLIEVTNGTNETTERIVGDCDVTITPSGAVDVTVDVWASMDHFGIFKYATARVRRDDAAGAVVATYSYGGAYFDPDSTSGHQMEWSTTVTDSSPTTGRYVLTLQATPNAARVFSDTHVLTLTSPSSITIAVPGPFAVTAAMKVPTVSLTPGDVIIAVPAPFHVTAAMHAPTVKLNAKFAPYTLDDNDSQALNIGVDLSARLEANPKPVAPPAGLTEDSVRLLRVSPVMPTPTLDSNGRPT